MRQIEERVAKTLNEAHEKRAQTENCKRAEAEVFTKDQKVWYRRPEGSGDKLDSRWLGPAIVLERVGENSYEIQIAEKRTIRAHASFLKPYIEDVFNGQPKPIFYHQRTVPDAEAAPDEWIVDKILNHRVRNGETQFLTKWEGYGAEEAVWEPIGNFFQQYNSEAVRYAQEHNLNVNLSNCLSAEPH